MRFVHLPCCHGAVRIQCELADCSRHMRLMAKWCAHVAIRELISNASDALDKVGHLRSELRFLGLKPSPTALDRPGAQLAPAGGPAIMCSCVRVFMYICEHHSESSERY